MHSACIIPSKQLFYTNLTPIEINGLQGIEGISNAVGYISYECYTEIENIIPPVQKSFCNFPKIHFSRMSDANLWPSHNFTNNDLPPVKWIKSNFTDASYKNAIGAVLHYIKKGTCYQVNLTRKFYGEFEYVPDVCNLFNKIYGISPNPYSMMYKLDDERAVISSSPECFLKRNMNMIHSIPIKGTISSELSPNALRNVKDSSENLMITDLVRNDIGKIAERVWVDDLQSIHKFGQVYHMSSKVCGQLCDTATNTDCVTATFPPGSMTGAPKIKAIQIANKLENIQRGVYSGCIGIIDDFCNFDFAVTIRTILIEGKKFEFQAGGAIVWDSVPEKEIEEVNLKIQPILQTLGLSYIKISDI